MRLPRAVVGVVIVALATAVVALDRRQAARGEPSLLSWPWRAGTPAVSRRAPPPRPRAPREARVALIVDELGSRVDVFERVLDLRRPVTVAVLPGLPLSRRLARDAARAGLEVLLQLPLEPYRFPEVDPGPGALLTSMPVEEVTRRTRQQLTTLPDAVGVLTRMGSRFTEDPPRMRALLEPLLSHRFFFVDSLTTHRSVGYDVARTLGISAGRRQVFVDPDESEASARAGLIAVERWASRRGAVIAIAHGRLLTLALLAEALPRWEVARLRLVPVSELVQGDRA